MTIQVKDKNYNCVLNAQLKGVNTRFSIRKSWFAVTLVCPARGMRVQKANTSSIEVYRSKTTFLLPSLNGDYWSSGKCGKSWVNGEMASTQAQ